MGGFKPHNQVVCVKVQHWGAVHTLNLVLETRPNLKIVLLTRFHVLGAVKCTLITFVFGARCQHEATICGEVCSKEILRQEFLEKEEVLGL